VAVDQAGNQSAPSPQIGVSLVGVDNPDQLPESVCLYQNSPNPFNPSTAIRYGLPYRSHVSLILFNTLGQQVSIIENGEKEAGYHEVRFDAKGLSSGVYLYRLSVGDFVQTRKFLLLK
jgi:hypothetical protein